jgi:asparagine synthase (glutamine-hydrolysing)
MCGIVGLVAFDAPSERARDIVSAMAEHIHHRGPDGGGVVTHPDATLGMKRLAIVDVEHGHQPMVNDDGSIALVYNGEVYNAPAIRARLEREGAQFRTRSDTEVILRLYERDPDRVEEELVGMWAFAIHDRRRRRVVLSRDRFGIKPLFVADTGASLAFASELHAFDRGLPGFARLFDVDGDAAHAMVSWSFIPESATIYRGVQRLSPGTRLEIDLTSGRRAERSYWSLAPSPEGARVRSLDEACEVVEALLRRAVREHLESDVPVATFLSGGIDSSLITALAMEESRSPIRSYSIGFREPRFDESPFARETARLLGVESRVEIFDEATAQAKLADVLCAYDEPFGDSSSLATYLLCEHVARDYKVALGGDGGDEVFAGYLKYQVVRMRQPFTRVPALRNAIAHGLAKLPTRYDRTTSWSDLLRQTRRVARGLGGGDAEVYAELTQIVPLARTERFMRSPSGARRFLEPLRARFEAATGTELQRQLACDLSNTLPNDMLVKVDRASMACHLEARVPFLDHRLVELGVGLPERYTLGLKGKRVLRALHERRFGKALANRKKQGFGVPVEAWLRGKLDGAASRLFASPRLDRYGVLSSATLGDGRHRQFIESDPMVLWHCFALAAWCEIHLGDGPGKLRELIAG